MDNNVRYHVAQALVKIDEAGAYSNITLNRLAKEKLDQKDTAFAAALFYGTIERMITLDACIAANSRLPLKKLDATVKAILRTAIYQLLYMASVPDSAAVNMAVALAKDFRKTSAGGFINAVLRSFLRSGKHVALPKSEAGALSVKYSCPEWIVALWLKSYGKEDTLGLLEGSLGRPPLYIRANTTKTTSGELVAMLENNGLKTALTDIKDCIEIADSGDIQNIQAFKDGLFHVQDKASQTSCLALGAQPGDRVLDCCGAPGGKSFTIAGLMGDRGEVLCLDIHEFKTKLIAESAAKLGLGSVKSFVNNAAVFNEKLGEFDKILCDVPCSGLGIIRRKPEIKYKDKASIAGLPALAQSILNTSARYLKKGGVLVFSTCTLNPAENEAVAQRFLEDNKGFAPKALPEEIAPANKSNMITLMPHKHKTDGFFVAAFQKTGDSAD